MVHVFCLDENCRRVIHLDTHKHWDFKGKVKCLKCGAEMEVEIKNGELISSRKSKRKSRARIYDHVNQLQTNALQHHTIVITTSI